MNQGSLFDDQRPAAAEAVNPQQSSPPEAGAARVHDPRQEYTTEERSLRMASLQEQALGCTRCELCHSRSHVVFGEGSINTPLVLVGEGPGENEDATGRPFVGRAGKLLDAALAENGMERRHVYICNVIKCRATAMENGRVMNRPPRVEEIGACRDWLMSQLSLIRPMVILCLGSPAANALIHPNFAITRERGQWFRDQPYAPWMMAAFHPAYILRQHGAEHEAARASLVRDIGAARLKVVELRKAARAAGERGCG